MLDLIQLEPNCRGAQEDGFGADFLGVKENRAMRGLHFIVGLLSLGLCPWACAQWSELLKEEEVAYYMDKASVMPVHVSRYVWTLVDLSKEEKSPTGDNYRSSMVRWRVYCKSDTIIPISVSYFEKPMGKGREVTKQDVQEFRTRETPIRPNTYLAALKKEVCAPRESAGS